MQAAVTDTHALLFHASGGQRLGPKGKSLFAAAESRAGLIYVPVGVVWELTLLARLGRVELGRPVQDFFTDLFSNHCFQPHTTDVAQALTSGEMTAARDPFDALICAAAVDLSLPLLSRDTVIVASGVVRTLW